MTETTPIPEPVIALHDLSRRFGAGAAAVDAVREVNLVVAAGDHVAISGPSGSGKSTLLNLIGLLDRPTSGSYRIAGRQTADLSDRQLTHLRGRSIGFVFQSFHLIARRTAMENVQIGLMYAGVPRRRRRTMAQDALARVGMSHRRTADPATLSGGERQRVAVARALASSPALLLCDEPTGNLDSVAAASLIELLAMLNRHGTTLVVVTHDVSVASAARRQLHMRDGRLTEAVPVAGPATLELQAK